MNDARFTRTRSAFAMTCRVEVSIRASAEVVWRLLTDAEGFPRWNSTVTRVEGDIREGERLRLHVPGTKRTFTPKVSGVVTSSTDGLERWRVPCVQGCPHLRAHAARPWLDRSCDGGTFLGFDLRAHEGDAARLPADFRGLRSRLEAGGGASRTRAWRRDGSSRPCVRFSGCITFNWPCRPARKLSRGPSTAASSA